MPAPTPADFPLTIALVSTQRNWYGGEEQIRLLAQGLRRRGHTVCILARRGGQAARRLADAGFDVGQFCGRGRNPPGWWQIRRHLRRLRPDVLQYNDSHALTAAGLASCGLRIPLRVAMRHVSLPIHAPWRFRRLSDRVICVSQAVADVCRAAGLPNERLRVVFPATDAERIRSGDRQSGRAAAGVSDQRPMILVVASLTENKGHRFLLDAMPAVLRRHPAAMLILTSDGPQKEAIQNQALRLGIGDSVRMLGYCHNLPDLMRGADLLVLPSIAGEGLPATLLDAMFAGLPIVTTEVGGIPELVGRDDPRGEPAAWLAPPRDSSALAAAILDALERPDQRMLRAARALRRAEAMFTVDRMVEATLAVYRETLGKTPGVGEIRDRRQVR